MIPWPCQKKQRSALCNAIARIEALTMEVLYARGRRIRNLKACLNIFQAPKGLKPSSR